MRLWRILNILSIDIALGAVICCAFMAKVLGVSLLVHAYVALGLIVWIIYTVDHLLDASMGIGELSTNRHRFHRHYWKALAALAFVAMWVVAVEVFFVRKPVFYAGLVVALLVIVYLAIQRSLSYFKELAGALLYTAGVVAAPISLHDAALTTSQWGLVWLLGLAAYTNLMICSYYDIETDLQDNHRSFATKFGAGITRWIIYTGLLLNPLMGVLLLTAFDGEWSSLVVLLAMNVILFIVFQFPSVFKESDRYRLLADLAFLVPVIYLLIDGIQ